MIADTFTPQELARLKHLAIYGHGQFVIIDGVKYKIDWRKWEKELLDKGLL